MNIMMFPSSRIPLEVYKEILLGGYDKAKEAGVNIIGGHSIDDYPPKYGLAVIGTVHPEKIITNAGAKAGDVLILTKPIGTGIILAAHRLGLASSQHLEEVKRFMMRLNNDGARLMQKYGVTGATDITGFGLAGHALKMARGSGVTIRLSMKSVPLADGTYALAAMACIPGAAFRNLEYVERESRFGETLDYNLKMIAHDAQTSGGLLISVAEAKAEALLSDLREAGHPEAAVIGTVEPKQDYSLIIG
jgi:selenide,water dikinase